MAACPPQIRYLSEGKAVGAKSNKGFVATWNWLLSCIFHLKGGSGVSVRGKWKGAPVIDCQIVAGDGIDVTCAGDGAPYVISLEGGGGSGGTTVPGPFEPVYTGGVISGCANCVFCAERQFVDCGTMTLTATASDTGYVVLTLQHPYSANATFSASSASLAVESSLPTNASDAVTKIPIFHITNGVVDVDLRAVPTGVLAR